jgi:hypothetical protein
MNKTRAIRELIAMKEVGMHVGDSIERAKRGDFDDTIREACCSYTDLADMLVAISSL